MKAIILMAGKGTRMAKYYDGPKQLLPVKGKPVIEHILDQLPEEITEFVFVVGGPHEQTIREYFSTNEYKGRAITFVVQKEQLGLAHAFKTAQGQVSGRWLGMVGDDIHGPEGIRELLKHDVGVLACRVPNPENFGVLVTDEDGYLEGAVEKPEEFVSDLVWNGVMVMDDNFFQMEIEPSDRGEYETPDVWMKLIEAGKKIKVVESDLWLPVNDKPQLEDAEKALDELEKR